MLDSEQKLCAKRNVNMYDYLLGSTMKNILTIELVIQIIEDSIELSMVATYE